MGSKIWTEFFVISGNLSQHICKRESITALTVEAFGLDPDNDFA
jgi:hypothetical protein